MRRRSLTGGRRAAAVLCAGAAIASLSPLCADTVITKDGERINGKVTETGQKSRRVVSPYGRLLIPNERIDRIIHDDGREEVVASADNPGRWRTESVRLDLAVLGDSFWQAWSPREAPADPSLRLLVSLDRRPIAAYQDTQLDDDIKGAVVNTFAFDLAGLLHETWEHATAQPAVVVPGRVALRIDLPKSEAGRHLLGFAYQGNSGTRESPRWDTIRGSTLEIDLGAGAPARVRIEQSREQMAFGGLLRSARMRNIESFRVQVFPEHEPEPALE